MANTTCHIELDTTDLARSQTFYAGIFDWTFRQFMETMIAFGSGDAHVGGLMLVDKVEPGKSPSIWIQVDDIDATLGSVKSQGGAVVTEKGPVPHVGWSAQFSDLDGNTVGIVQFENQG